MPEHFCSIFPRRDQFIWKLPDDRNWKKANGPLLDHQILGVVSDEGRGLFRGCYWSHKTRHAVLDIDAGSKYHQAAELQKLQEKLAAVGLHATPYQSSDSGGWHLYIFFDDWEDSSQVERSLKSWLKAQGYSIECGQLEVFPSGNALRLPLQRGFGWLAPEGNLVRRREEIRVEEALASFLLDLTNNQRNWSEAKDRIESQISSAGGAAGAGDQAHRKAIEIDGFDRLWNSGQIPERIEEARHYLDNGLTEDGSRHAAVYSIQHLLWFGDRARGVPRLPGTHNDEKRWRFVKEWLEKKHNGKSWHVNRGNWRVLDGHMRRAAEWRRQDHQPATEYVPYMVTERAEDAMIGLTKKTGHLFTPEDLERANQKREEEARKRIRAAVQLLIDQGRRVRVRQLMRLARCCNKTIKRHSDIWSISPVVALPSVGGDLDPGGVGGLPALGCSGSEKESFLPVLTESDSGDLEAKQPIPSTVAPLQFCPAESLPEDPQHKDRALRVAAQVFTPGPWSSGIRAERQMCAGGDSFIFQPGSVCYTNATANGIRERSGAASGVSALVAFGTENKNEKIIPDATNYRFLTTTWRGFPSGFTDEFSLIINPRLCSNGIENAIPRHRERKHGSRSNTQSLQAVHVRHGESSGGGMVLPAVLGAVSSLFVISETYRLTKKQTSVDVRCIRWLGEPLGISLHQPTASASESTSTCLQRSVRVYRFSAIHQVPKMRACPACKHWLDLSFGILTGAHVRGPPKCKRLMKSQSMQFTLWCH